MTKLFSLFLFLLGPLEIRAGCYQHRLCCPGRNNTCKVREDISLRDVEDSMIEIEYQNAELVNPRKATDDGIDHIPLVHQLMKNHLRGDPSIVPYQVPHYESSGDGYDLVYPSVYDQHEKIGKLVLPDVVELEGSGAENIYNKYGPHDEKAPANIVNPTTPARKITHLLFGRAEGPDTEPEDQLKYSVLSQHLPLTVSSSRLDAEEPYRIQYLEAVPIDCYCDERCVALGDCCSDYTFVCPPRDCFVEEWTAWSECKADNGRCGIGEQQRERRVIHPAERGGAECPSLKEMRTCHKACPTKNLEDLTTVALLLNYRYNETRQKKRRNNVYWDHPRMAKKLNETSFYCVEYEIGWVNRNCIDKSITARLHRGNTICAECQPEATLHRNTARCASDLEDGDEGFWKLIGPKSCNGIWRRLRRKDHCRCSRDLAERDPFLLV